MIVNDWVKQNIKFINKTANKAFNLPFLVLNFAKMQELISFIIQLMMNSLCDKIDVIAMLEERERDTDTIKISWFKAFAI